MEGGAVRHNIENQVSDYMLLGASSVNIGGIVDNHCLIFLISLMLMIILNDKKKISCCINHYCKNIYVRGGSFNCW